MPKRIKEPETVGLVGYARVSTADQNLDMQEKALKRFGCLKIFTDTASGRNADRPGLSAALDFLRSGDTLVVWKLDRLGRSVSDLIKILDYLKDQGVKFHSMQDQINTESAAGRMFFQIVATFAEFERNLISERTRTGLAAARARGNVGGRKAKLNQQKVDQARALLSTDPPTKFIDVCRLLDCSPRTLRRGLEDYPAAGPDAATSPWPAIAAKLSSLGTSHPPRASGTHRHV